MTEAGRIVGVTYQTMWAWREKAKKAKPKNYKEYGRYHIYFKVQEIKQDTAKNLPNYKG